MPEIDMLQELQDRVTSQMNEEDVANHRPMRSIDISTWLSALQALIQTFQQCKAVGGTTPAASAAAAIANPTMLQKLRLRKNMINAIGRPAYRAHGDELHAKFLEVGEAATEADRQAFVTQVLAQG